MNQRKEITLTKKQVRNRTLRSFLFLFLFFAGCILAWKWMRSQPEDAGEVKPLRTVLNFNEKIFQPLVNDNNLARTYPLSAAVKKVRVNGSAGMSAGFDPATWKLQLIRTNGDTLFLAMEDIRSLPKTEIVFDFKCIEGWSQVTHWGGVRFTDFIKKYGLEAESQLSYVGLHTPDNGYYVGIDRASIMHPQTMLCYEMNGAPLPLNQGFPLRLIIPVKYGIKHLKRIGTIFFSNERPRDYWYERGYDYFGGL